MVAKDLAGCNEMVGLLAQNPKYNEICKDFQALLDGVAAKHCALAELVEKDADADAVLASIFSTSL